MFGNVKRWLGIEGVKVELILPDQVRGSGGVIEGKLRFSTMHTQKVKKIRITLTEKYTRGRWKDKLADLYKIADIELVEDVIVPANEPIEIDFEL
ncbi:MAG: sporulation protein, partial [Saprospiraceae bacterium]